MPIATSLRHNQSDGVWATDIRLRGLLSGLLEVKIYRAWCQPVLTRLTAQHRPRGRYVRPVPLDWAPHLDGPSVDDDHLVFMVKNYLGAHTFPSPTQVTSPICPRMVWANASAVTWASAGVAAG